MTPKHLQAARDDCVARITLRETSPTAALGVGDLGHHKMFSRFSSEILISNDV